MTATSIIDEAVKLKNGVSSSQITKPFAFQLKDQCELVEKQI